MMEVLGLVAVTATLFLSAVYSGAETALYRASRVRMRLREEAGDRRAAKVRGHFRNMAGLVTTILVGHNLMVYLGSNIFTNLLAGEGIPSPEFLATLVLTPLYFIFSDSLPKQLALGSAELWAVTVAGFVGASKWLFAPAVWFFGRVASLFGRDAAISEMEITQRARLIEYLDVGVAEKVLTDDQNRMAKRIMEFEAVTAADVMIPRHRLFRLPESETRSRTVARMRMAGADIALLTDQKDVPTGKIVTLNLLARNPGSADQTIGDVGKNLCRIRANMPLPLVLRKLRQEHAQRALITARGGMVVGLITSRTLLDRIVGLSSGTSAKKPVAPPRAESGHGET